MHYENLWSIKILWTNIYISSWYFMKQQKLNKLIHISRNNEFLGVYCHLFLNFIMWKLSPTMHLIFCHIAYIQIFCTQILWRMLYPKSISSRPPNYQPKVKDIIMVQFFNPITPLHLHHSQTVDKTDKTVLWGEQVWYFKWTASIDFFKDAFFKGHSYPYIFERYKENILRYAQIPDWKSWWFPEN